MPGPQTVNFFIMALISSISRETLLAAMALCGGILMLDISLRIHYNDTVLILQPSDVY